MARYDESQSYTPDYDDDCAYCGEEFPRGELAWIADKLCCTRCEDKRDDDERRQARKTRELAELFATEEIQDTSEDPCTDHGLEVCPDCGNAGTAIGPNGLLLLHAVSDVLDRRTRRRGGLTQCRTLTDR